MSDIFKRYRGGAAQQTDNASFDDDEGGPSGAYRRIREAEILAAIDRLPALPVVVQRVLGSMSDDKTDARALDELISQDMVITGRVLKLVNSPFYNQRNQVSSLQQAVALMGQRSLRSLVVAVSARDIMSADMSVYGFGPNGMWLNSMVTANLARRAGELLKLPSERCDEAFVAGLLRDVGMLVLGPILKEGDLTLQATDAKGIDIIDRERSLIGYDHGWVGERVCSKWKLPQALTTVIGKHHRVPSTMDDDIRLLMTILRIAERLAYTAKAGIDGGHNFDTAVDAPLLRAAGMKEDVFRSLLQAVPSVIESAKAEL